MKKFVFLMTIIAVTYGFTVAVAAGTTGPLELDTSYSRNEAKVEKIVNRANDKIEAKIEAACEKADRILMDYNNGFISEEKKNLKITRLIQGLETRTSKIADRAKARALDLGVEVGCEYTRVVIDGREVLIDPLFIIGT